jgi:hypothetical protein
MGPSGTSTAGNGGVITLSTVPAAPVSLALDPVNTLSGQITLTWQAGSYSGGQPIDYYLVSSDQSIGVWVVLAGQVSGTTYTATGLVPGNTYMFVVQAHNAIGFSANSA